MAPLAAEIARRSASPDPSESIARREGFRSAGQLIASNLRGAPADAERLIAVGENMAAAQREARRQEAGDGGGLSGDEELLESVPAGPHLPYVAAASAEARIGVDAAAAIIAMAQRVWRDASPEALAKAERMLVDKAQHLDIRKLGALIKRVEASLSVTRLEDKERRQIRERHLSIYEDRDGMIAINGRLDAATGLPIKAAVEAIVTRQMQLKRDRKNAVPDDRTVPQMTADALSALASHALGCTDSSLPIPATTVVVRMDVEALKAELGALDGAGDDATVEQRECGIGTVDGLAQPMTAGQLRRLAAGARVIPEVLGGPSQPLDLGRNRRLFTHGQRLALVERDGGCASCGAPPSWCDAHHIRWWKEHRGRTDLNNGVLLCRACHTRIHEGRWKVEIHDGMPVFLPPPEYSGSNAPQIGGRRRFDVLQ